jgi:hypothetical protein
MCVCLEDTTQDLPDRANALRASTAKWYTDNERTLTNWLEHDKEADEPTSAADYIAYIAKPGNYAGDREIIALASMLKRNVRVFVVSDAANANKSCPGTLIQPLAEDAKTAANKLAPLAIACFPPTPQQPRSGHYVPLIRCKHAPLMAPHRHSSESTTTAPPPGTERRPQRRTRSQVSEATQGSSSSTHD